MASPSSSRNKEPVIIAGGGIGGLAAALALARKGFKSVVLEQAPQLAESAWVSLQRPAQQRRPLLQSGSWAQVPALRGVKPGDYSAGSVRPSKRNSR